MLYPAVDGLMLDTKFPDCCMIDTEHHLKESLGEPLTLPPTLAANLGEDWANTEQNHTDLLALFALITGEKYEEVHRDNSYNNETDLSTFFVFTVYAPINNCPDWCWQRDTFIVIEIGAGGDPRYSSYSGAQVYRLDDTTIADSGFLDWRLSYWLEPIASGYDRSVLDGLNDRISAGYSGYPYGELRDACHAEPVWNDRQATYLCRPKGIPFPCRMMPHLPYYGS